MRLKILLITSMVPRAEAGGAIPVLLDAQLTGLRERSTVTLISAVGDEPGEAEAAAALKASGLDARVADRRQPASPAGRWRRRWQLAAAWAFTQRPWRSVWFAVPGVQRLVDRAVATQDFDVIVVEDSAMSSLRLPDGVPTVLTEHEVLRPRPLDRRIGRPSEWARRAAHELDWRRRPRFQRAGWRRFDRILVFTRRDAESIAELAPEVRSRVRVSPFGTIVPPPADPGRENPATLLFVGNFFHQPNRDAATWLAREIMPAVLARHPSARLRIVGTAPPREILELAGPSVEVVADAPSVRPHLEAAALVLAPVRTGGGMRMKVLQALAAGKAVVTTPRGAEGFDVLCADLPLVVGESGVGIASTVNDLLSDPARRHELGTRARGLVERHYSPGAWADRLLAIYAEAGAQTSVGGHPKLALHDSGPALSDRKERA